MQVISLKHYIVFVGILTQSLNFCILPRWIYSGFTFNEQGGVEAHRFFGDTIYNEWFHM